MLHAALLAALVAQPPVQPPAVGATQRWDDRRPVRSSEVRRREASYQEDGQFVPRIGPSLAEVALQDESYWVAYGRRFGYGSGLWTVGLYGSDDDELAFTARVLRFADYDLDRPFSVGIGVAGYALVADDPDTDAQAIALAGQVSTWFDETTYPITAVLDVAWAPDVSTFGDGDRVLDLWGRLELEISPNAQVFCGYRHLRVDLDGGAGERDLGESLQVGVRLGW